MSNEKIPSRKDGIAKAFGSAPETGRNFSTHEGETGVNRETTAERSRSVLKDDRVFPIGQTEHDTEDEGRIWISAGKQDEDRDPAIVSLRPEKLHEYVGQTEVVKALRIAIEAARKRKEPLEHVLFHGPPGLGKTTLAHIIANEMQGNLTVTSGPALEKGGDLVGLLMKLEKGDVFFVDEIHRTPRAVEEILYPAMEDFSVDFVIDKGRQASSIRARLNRFVLVGATTRVGLLTAPLRDRFGILRSLDFYGEEELVQITRRSAALLDIPIDDASAWELSRRSRGTPRIVNRLLKRVRDYAQVLGDGKVVKATVEAALELEGVDRAGLTGLDRRYLNTIIQYYNGGPVGIEAIAATLQEETDTLVDVVEPYLLKIGFVLRTASGRKASDTAFRHLGHKVQGRLF